MIYVLKAPGHRIHLTEQLKRNVWKHLLPHKTVEKLMPLIQHIGHLITIEAHAI